MARSRSRLVLVFLLCAALHALWGQCGPQHVPFGRQAFIGTSAAGRVVPAKGRTMANVAAPARTEELSETGAMGDILVWYLLKGKPQAYRVRLGPTSTIVDLKEAVHQQCGTTLTNVDAVDLLVYESKAAFDSQEEALRGDEKIANLPSSVTYDNPLHVAYEEPKIGGAGVSEAPLRKGGTGSGSFLWVQVKGGEPVEYPTEDLRNVGGLLKAVFIEEEARLKPRGVTVSLLRLYASEEAYKKNEAFEVDEKVNVIVEAGSGKTAQEPLYVDYPEPGGSNMFKVGRRIMEELRKGLPYSEPSPLIGTQGKDWDYRGVGEVVEQLQPAIRKLVENKGRNEDKGQHPIILVLAGPGQGKSRYLSELPVLVNETGELTGSDYGKKTFTFLLTLENGQSPTEETADTPERILAARMLWQLVRLRNRNAEGWAGLPQGFTFSQLLQRLPASIKVDDVLHALARGEQLKPSDRWSVVLGLDGLQELAGLNEDSREQKGTLSYRTIRCVCNLVNRVDGPLVVGAIAATVQRRVQDALADSPQARIYVTLPLVDQVLRGGTPVLDFPQDRKMQLLVKDMGGHGRALEALEKAIKTQQPPALLMGAVTERLIEAYPEAVPFDFEPVLRAALAGVPIPIRGTVDGIDPEKLPLTRLEYDVTRKSRRIVVPYIWIHLGLQSNEDLKDWAMEEYIDLFRPDASGAAFENFCARFRQLKSLVFPNNSELLLKNLHRGAMLQPEDLRGVKIINKHLQQRVKLTTRIATNSKSYGQQKARRNSAPPKVEASEVLKGELNGSKFITSVLQNAEGAPAADYAVLLSTTNNTALSDCGQPKQGSAAVNRKIIREERKKACDEHDFLLLICSGNKSINRDDLPDMTGLVDAKSSLEYFGPYAGRAWYSSGSE